MSEEPFGAKFKKVKTVQRQRGDASNAFRRLVFLYVIRSQFDKHMLGLVYNSTNTRLVFDKLNPLSLLPAHGPSTQLVSAYLAPISLHTGRGRAEQWYVI